jgi:hypothetical protein
VVTDSRCALREQRMTGKSMAAAAAAAGMSGRAVRTWQSRPLPWVVRERT